MTDRVAFPPMPCIAVGVDAASTFAVSSSPAAADVRSAAAAVAAPPSVTQNALRRAAAWLPRITAPRIEAAAAVSLAALADGGRNAVAVDRMRLPLLAAAPSAALTLSGGSALRQWVNADPHGADVRMLTLNDVTDADFVILGRLSPSRRARIDTLVLEPFGVSRPTAAGLAHLQRFSLKALDVPQRYFGDAEMQMLSQLRSLESLNIIGSRISDVAMRALSNLPVLHTLNVEASAASPGALADMVGRLPLRRLDIYTSGDTSACVRAVAGSRTLQELHVSEYSPGLTEDGLRAAARMAKLTAFTFPAETLSVAGAVSLATMPSLRDLAIRYCATDAAAAAVLVRSPTLRSLTFGECTLAPGTIVPVAASPTLRQLAVRGCTLAEADRTALLNNRALTSLDLTETYVPLEMAVTFARHPALVALRLPEASVSRWDRDGQAAIRAAWQGSGKPAQDLRL